MEKGLHTFTEGISLKVKVKPWLEFELAYYDGTDQPVSLCTFDRNGFS